MKVNKAHISVVLIVVTMVVIFVLSAQPSSDSYGLSLRVADLFRRLGLDAHIPLIDDSLEYTVRKMAHVTLYAILGVVSSCGVACYMDTLKVKRPYLLSLVISLLICFAYACLDEFHQTFVYGRTGKFSDVGYDSIGFVTTTLSVLAIRYAIARRTQRRHTR